MKLIQFIYKDTIIAQQNAEMFLNQIDEVKWLLANVDKFIEKHLHFKF